MEHTVNKHATTSPPKNLHPIWYRHFGVQTLQPTPTANRPQPSQPQRLSTPRADGQILLRAVQALVASRGPIEHVY